MEGGYGFLLDLALILLSTKLLGLLTQRFQLPQVVGALLAGLILGPAVLNVIQETEFIKDTAEIGVIVMMFCAGMETDVNELKHSGKAAFIIALIGVLVPIGGGFALAYFFNQPGVIESDATTPVFLQNMFIGVILTATSVSISVETLKELGKLKTRSGNAILGAAIIDDVLGIVALTIITSMSGTGANVLMVLLKIAAFFAISVVVWIVLHRIVEWWFKRYDRDKRRFVVISFAFCLLYAYFAEEVFGVADILHAALPHLLRQPGSEGGTAGYERLHRSFLRPADPLGCSLQGGGLRAGRQTVPLLQSGFPPHRRGHDLPGRGCLDRGQQRHCGGADERRLLWSRGADGYRNHHPHPHFA